MKCKYFALRGACKNCVNMVNKGEIKECPIPNIDYFKAVEWWKENRTDNMIEFFDKLEVNK